MAAGDGSSCFILTFNGNFSGTLAVAAGYTRLLCRNTGFFSLGFILFTEGAVDFELFVGLIPFDHYKARVAT